MVEADVTINGTALTFAQSMSLRVAVSSFRMSLSDPELAGMLGLHLASNYDHHLAQIEALMLGLKT